MEISHKIGQLFFIGIPGPELDGATRELLDEVNPGGICLFARNIRDARKTWELLNELREFLPEEPFLSIDQEGGLVDRLRRIITPMPAPAKLRSPEDAARLGTYIAEALRSLGFNMNFAPVVDAIDAGRMQYSNGLQTRNFGSSREDVVAFADAFISALEARGILGCIKHFPGLGASTVDSHDDLPKVTIDEEEFEQIDLFPYRALLSKFPHLSVMIGHATYPNLSLQDVDRNGNYIPSSLSPSMITGLLRKNMGFEGLTITDDLEMGAIVKHYGIGMACVMAVNAGIDMLAICASPEAIREGFAAVSAAVASGEIESERLNESVARIRRHRGFLASAPEFDERELADIADRVKAFSEELA
jgi:beta-N-acetylhexosaminidase